MTPQAAVLLAPWLPVLGAVAIVLTSRWPRLRDAISVLTAVLLLGVVAWLVRPVLEGERPYVHLIEMLPGLSLAFEVEPLGLVFALVASGLWLPAALYSIGYMRANHEAHQTRFAACFALSIASAIGVAFAGNLLTLFLFYELLTLITWPLVIHHGDAQARAGGRTYLTLLLGTSTLFLLPAIIATFVFAGTLDFVPGGVLPADLSPHAATLLLMLYAFGIGKAALMPFHRWLPAAMVAPTPVSALLHAVAVVKAGVFCIVKVVVYVFGLAGSQADFTPLLVVAAFTLVAASVVALRSDNFKRRLAYSTVSQLAYVVLAVALLAPLSVVGAVLHIVAHALGKITLFFAAGAVYTTSHRTLVSELDGLGRRMPWTFGAFAVASLSIIGLPPALGMLAKWYIVGGAWEVRSVVALAAVAVGTLLSAAYLLPVVYRAFFRPAGGAPAVEAPLSMLLPTCVSAALVVILFFWPDLPLALAERMLAL